MNPTFFKSVIAILGVVPTPLCSGDLFIKDDLELEQLSPSWMRRNTDDVDRSLKRLSSDELRRAIDARLRAEKDSISIETVFAKYSQAENDTQLSLKTVVPLAHPLTNAELKVLESLRPKGKLEIIGGGRAGKGRRHSYSMFAKQ